MNDKKNIDRLFQEKFKDFEVTPPEFVWENIEEKLREKKKRRVIPLWIKLSGVAAVLVIGSVLSVPYFSGIDTNETPVVIEKGGTKHITPTDRPIPNNGTIIVDTTIINGQNSAVASENTGDENNDKDNAAKGISVPSKESGHAAKHGASYNKGEAVAHDGSSTSGTKKQGHVNGKNRGKKSRHLVTVPDTEAVAQRASSGNDRKDGSTSGNPENATSQEIPGNTDKAVAETNDTKAQKPGLQDSSVPNSTGQENGIVKKDVPVEEAIAETPVDTASVLKPESELDKLWREKTEGKKDDEKAVAEQSNKGKWNVKPQVAPLFFNSMSEGSPIDGQFAGNSKSFDNDLSYGVGVNYAVTDRLSIRSGINTVNMSYATNDVYFRASLSGETNNVSARARTANIVVTNSQTQPTNIPGNIDGFEALSANGQSFDGSMIQTTGYIEVPVEMSYAILNRKFGIDVIGGVSTLFLNENNVSVVSDQGYSAEVGEAQNLNSVHFSTNIGLGFKYRFWKSFQANFEPTFKYQVNTYSRDAGNFKPYFIGLYSGISFSF